MIIRQLLVLLSSLFLFSPSSLANENVLILVDKTTRLEIPVESVRQQADLEFIIFEPFRGRQVTIRGLFLEQLLQKHLSRVPEKIRLTAHDEYEMVFANWKSNHWVVVTHEDGKPLSLRNQGPLRLIERHYQGRDPENLRDFNDWVWMLQTIAAVP